MATRWSESAFGRLRGRNRRGVAVGDPAVLFVRPETFSLGTGHADSTVESEVLNIAFEGNMTHLFFRGPIRRSPSSSLSPRGTGASMPEQGSRTPIRFDPEGAARLQAGTMARD